MYKISPDAQIVHCFKSKSHDGKYQGYKINTH